jgi:succinate-semialdehyde dehydrogenase / glutarate-semialdehyde dehydrogenase
MALTEAHVLERVPRRLLIGGAWRDSADGRTLAVEDPATGETLMEVADAAVDDAKDALGAAHDAFATFRETAPRERADILRRAHELIAERAEELALVMTLEMGKPLAESRAEVAYANDYVRWYAEEAVRIDGRFAVNGSGAGRVLTMRQPVGPCLLITPWNFPLAMGARKIAPALAAGCTCVIKPAAQTPLSMLLLGEILADAGAPDGAVNVLAAGRSAATMEPLIADPRTRKLSFTGSTAVGRALIAQSARQVLRVSMELGGNAPFLVFEDADVDAAVDGAVIAKMRNGGEACTAANRIYVHDDVATEFAAKLAERIGRLKVGRGTEPGVEVGPLIDGTQRQKVAELVEDATAKGARVLVGGTHVEGRGWFFAPTVLTDVPRDARLLQEEIFGPVAPIVRFADEQEAVDAANDTEYGLVAYVYTRDVERAFRVCERLDTGMIGLNQGFVSNAGAPFGGVKQSGFGREGGPEGLHEYLETKYLAMNVGSGRPASDERTKNADSAGETHECKSAPAGIRSLHG